jgi:hypothetical protein
MKSEISPYKGLMIHGRSSTASETLICTGDQPNTSLR